MAQPPGFGDFLRGTMALYQLSHTYGFDVKVDFSAHPLSRFLEQYDDVLLSNGGEVHEFFNDKTRELEPFVASLDTNATRLITTNAIPAVDIDDTCRDFVAKRISPKREVEERLRTLADRFGLGTYCVVHVRMGDHGFGGIVSTDRSIEEYVRNVILPEWGHDILVMSDNSAFKQRLSEKFGVMAIPNTPVHLGQCGTIDLPFEGVCDALVDFHLMARAAKIYQYSVYPWGSGFSDVCAHVYGVALERIPKNDESNPTCASRVSDNMNIQCNTLKLDIACGKRKKPGFTGVDIWEGADIVCDLERFPWPFEDNSVDEIFCSHYIEHTPDLISFANELYRIMKVGAKAEIIAPYYSSIRAWQDPTHLRAISEATFFYFNKEWRDVNKLDHYPIVSDFDIASTYSIDSAWQDKDASELKFAIRHYINVVSDIRTVLTKRRSYDVELLLKQADEYWEVGRFEDAIEICHAVVSSGNASSEIHLMLAEYALKVDELNNAIKSFRQVLLLDNESFQAHVGIIRAFIQAGLIEEAQVHLAEVKNRDPDLAELIQGVIGAADTLHIP